MRAILLKDLVVDTGRNHMGQSQQKVLLKTGSVIQVIDWRWIYKDAKFLRPIGVQSSASRENLENDTFAIHYRGHLIVVPKSICEVPKIMGGRYNI